MRASSKFIGIALLLVAAAPAVAVITFMAHPYHDELDTRIWAQRHASMIGDTQVWPYFIEAHVVLDPEKPDTHPNKIQRSLTLSRESIEAKLGKPSGYRAEDYSRPWAGNLNIPLSGMVEDDVKPENDRIKFYEVKGVGGVRIVYNKDGNALNPAILYLKVDSKFVPLKHEADFARRVEWEHVKLLQLMKSWGVGDPRKSGSGDSVELDKVPRK